MKHLAFSVCGVMALLALSGVTTADTVVYDNTGGITTNIDQQTGNNYYYIGDTVTLPTTGTLTTIQILFGSSYYNPTTNGVPFTYTPDVTLDLYLTAADANAHTNLIGSAVVNNVTFNNDGIVDPTARYNYENEQFLTFDFTSQNIALPTTFAFAYHDTPPVGSNVDGANGFSVGLKNGGSLSPGFYTYPNSPTGTGLFPEVSPGDGYNVEARISIASPVPLPSSAVGGLTLLAGLGLVTGVKRMRRQYA